MKTKTYNVISNDNGKTFEHELTIKSTEKKNKTVHELYHSDNKNWTAHTRGQLILRVIDTGNDMKIEYGCDFSELEYDEAEYLYVILKHMIKNYNGPVKLKHKIKLVK